MAKVTASDLLSLFNSSYQGSSKNYAEQQSREAASAQHKADRDAALAQLIKAREQHVGDVESQRSWQEGQTKAAQAASSEERRLDRESRKELSEDRIDARIESTQVKAAKKAEEEAAKKAPKSVEERMRGMKSFDKTRYGFYSEGLKEINNMLKHIDEGGSRYSALGDNPYTLSMGKIYNALARPETGAAIPAHEQEAYTSQLRSALDTPDMSRKKLQDIRAKMEAGVSLSGIEPNEIPGYAPYQLKTQAPSMVKGVGRELRGLITGYQAPVAAPTPSVAPSIDSMSDDELLNTYKKVMGN